jgi:hypothetical protein
MKKSSILMTILAATLMFVMYVAPVSASTSASKTVSLYDGRTVMHASLHVSKTSSLAHAITNGSISASCYDDPSGAKKTVYYLRCDGWLYTQTLTGVYSFDALTWISYNVQSKSVSTSHTWGTTTLIKRAMTSGDFSMKVASNSSLKQTSADTGYIYP